MQLTQKQQEGLEMAVARYYNGQRYTVIAGYAGTGKSTLVKHIIAALDIKEQDVVYCAYTGKATLVLSNKGCKNTSTLHRLLYHAKRNQFTGKYYFEARTCLEHNYKIVVIDEVSMLSDEMWQLLLKHNVYVLALGDPGQLGPVKSEQDSKLLDSPNIFLTEIMRQAEGNEIIHWSMKIREGKPLQKFDGEHVRILDKNELELGMLNWADIVLCAKNDTRHYLNAQMKFLRDLGTEPVVGDKIICLKNYWDIVNLNPADKGYTPLVNGMIGYIIELKKYHHPILDIPILDIVFENETGDIFENLQVDYNLMTTGQPGLTYIEYRNKTAYCPKESKPEMPLEFGYGYAITGWKSQGSEWDNVLLFEENFPWKKEEKKRYLYTGITRASEKLVVIRK